MIGTIIGNKTLTFSALALAAMTVVGTASYAGSNDAGTTIPVVCEVVATTAGGGTTLEAIYNAQGPENGTYRFSVKTVGGAGNTNINQGGGFSAPAAGPISLGRVTVGNAPSYDIDFTVEVGNQTFDCLEPNGKRA
ncbi:curli-like amyloid fiber formation chaperone CsgH [Pelagibacterium mangrovi]|uniref:curli-like amyloid fiber formation chaperone CsgH n=1 Tax=Pelagibacterium mangrovi TaxID=3119828 RepID=UPI002FC596BD